MNHTHMMVQLDSYSTSFCFYHNSNLSNSNYELIELEHLRRTIDKIKDDKIGLIIIYSHIELPSEYKELLNNTYHEKIYPLQLSRQFNKGILVINDEDLESIHLLSRESARNIILRVTKNNIKNIFEIFRLLEGTFARLTIILLDIDTYTDIEIENYKNQLEKIREIVVKWLTINRSVEINVLTDRLLLRHMNNCDAGVRHITLAPDGNTYICPAFYFDKNISSLGMIDSEQSDLRLLKLDSSPICSICDAYHCRRCVYLNKKITSEFNIPSREQCVLSHEERKQSKMLHDEIVDSIKNYTVMSPLPDIDYLDPFELLKRKKHDVVRNDSIFLKSLDDSIDISACTDREILIRIYEQNKKILSILLKNSSN